MNVQAKNCKIKMVVAASATALALGIGALALCVVPWFYSKSDDDPDDEPKETPIGISIDSRSRRPTEENDFSSSTGFRTICLRGFDFVKVIIPKTCVTPNTYCASVSGESVAEKFTGFYRENSSVETKIPVRASSAERSNGDQPRTRRVPKEAKKREFSDSLEMRELERDFERSENTSSIADRKSARSALRRSIDSNRSDRKSIDSRYLRPRFKIQNVASSRESGKFLDPKTNRGSSESRLSPIVEENASNLWSSVEGSSRKTRVLPLGESDRVVTSPWKLSINERRTNDSSNDTDESSTSRSENREIVISRRSSAKFSRPATPPERSSAETNGNPTLRATSFNVISQVNSPTSNPSVASSGASTNELVAISRTSMPRRDPEAFLENTRIVGSAIAESQKMTDFLNKKEPSVGEESLRDDFSKNSNTNENSRKSLAGYSGLREIGSNATSSDPDFKCSICKNHQEGEKKMSDRSRRSSSFSERLMKRFRRDVKDEATPEARSNADRSRASSSESFPAGADLPTGHSTLTSIGTIGSRVFDQSLRCDYPGLRKLTLNVDEQPLDLSIRRDTDLPEKLRNSSDIHRKNVKSTDFCEKNENLSETYEKNEKSSLANRNSAGAAPCLKRSVFRDAIDFFKVKRTSPQNVMRSDSIQFYHDPSASFPKSEDENVGSKEKGLSSAELRAVNRCRIKNDISEKPRGRDFSQKFKAVFKFRDRPSDEFSLPGKNEARLETISGQIQRLPRHENSKLRKNGDPRYSKTFESPNIEDYIGPCTEL